MKKNSLQPSFFLFLLAVLPMLFSSTLYAQPAGWTETTVFDIYERTQDRTNHPVLLTINTETLVAQGKMNPTGSDIRFISDCSGENFLPYWIEEGMNTDSTLIWVNVPEININNKVRVYMFSGNPSANDLANFDATFPNQLIIGSGTTITEAEELKADFIHIQAGATLLMDTLLHPTGKLTLNAPRIVVEGDLTANGAGQRGGFGLENGRGMGGGDFGTYLAGISTGGGAGGGYGGAGGGMTPACLGGDQYGHAEDIKVHPGSGGGGHITYYQSPAIGGAGGGAFDLNGVYVKVSGNISCNGSHGQGYLVYSGGSGGGSGGGVLIRGNYLNLSGSISVQGGNGGNNGNALQWGGHGGGGGSGGRIKVLGGKSVKLNQTIFPLSGGNGTVVNRGSGNLYFNEGGEDGTNYISDNYISPYPFSSQVPYLSTARFFTVSNSIQYTFVNTTEGDFQYTWDFGDGNQDNSQSPIHNYTTPGIFQVCLEAKNICITDTVCQTIVAPFSNNPVVCPYQLPIAITENEGVNHTNFPVQVIIDTKSLIEKGRMASDGRDIRFYEDCAGNQPLSFFLESGINTPQTIFWVNLPSLAADTTVDIYMCHGDFSLANASSFDQVFTNTLIIDEDLTLDSSNTNSDWQYQWVEIKEGVTVTIDSTHPSGKLTIIANRILLNGNIVADFAGYDGGMLTDGNGPGGGKSGINPGGGSYGGKGADGHYNNVNSPAGELYGTIEGFDIDCGSGGGTISGSSGSEFTSGGNGGGCISLKAQNIDIKGLISVDGGSGGIPEAGNIRNDRSADVSSPNTMGAAGSGGGILVVSQNIGITGKLSADAGRYPSERTDSYQNPPKKCGGGGGGRIKVFYETDYQNSGVLTVNRSMGVPDGCFNGSISEKQMPLFFPTATAGIGSADIPIQTVLTSQTPLPTCPGIPLTFRVHSTGETMSSSYQWWVNNTLVPGETGNTFTLSTLQSGDDVQAVLISGNACARPAFSVSNTIEVNFHDIEKPMVETENGQSGFCNGDSLTLSTHIAGTLLQWNDAAQSNTSSIVVYSPGSYMVESTDTNGCVSVSEAIEIEEFELPDIPKINSLNNYTSFCPGDTFKLYTPDTLHPLMWNNLAQSTTHSIEILTPGTYSVTATSPHGCSSTSQGFEVSLSQVPSQPVITSFEGKSSFCPGDSIILSCTSTEENLIWNNGPESTSSQITVKDPGGYFVTVTNTEGCSVVSDTFHLSLLSAPEKPVIKSSLDVFSFCPGETLNLSAQTTETNISWSNGATTVDLNNVGPGDYWVEVTNEDGCVAQSDPVSIVEFAVPEVPVVNKTDEEITASPAEVNWYDGDGNLKGTGSPFAPDSSGQYYAVYTDENGCTSLPSDTLFFDTTVSIGKWAKKQENILVYPNPVYDGKVKIEFSGEPVIIRVYDVSGKHLETIKLKNTGNIQLEGPGTRILEIEDNYQTVRKQIILL